MLTAPVELSSSVRCHTQSQLLTS